MIHSIN